MLIWKTSLEAEVALEAEWPRHPDPCADCLGATPGHYRSFFEVNPIGHTQAPGVLEPRPVHGGLWSARYVERAASEDDADIFHVVGSDLNLVEALQSCQRYSATDGRSWTTP